MRVVLFTGKGGVGKTTLAAATAALLAWSGRKALVVSTDPAHSLGDALGTELGPDPVEIEESLYAAHIDARALLEGAWGDLQEHLRTILAGAGVDELVADELTVLPGVEDLLALAEVQRLADTGEYDVLVVDCGPTAETLRFLTLPEALSGYLERLFPAHRRAVRGLVANLAGARGDGAGWERTVDALGLLAEQLAGLRAMLGDRSRTSIRLVLTPERVVAAETRRTLTALALHELRVDALVANRVMPGPPPSLRGPAARWLRERHGEQQAVLGELEQLAGGVPVHAVRYTAAEPTGTAALREIARSLYGHDDPAPEAGPTGPGTPLLQLRRTAGHGVSQDTEFEMTVALPGSEDAPLDLARVGDDMVIGLGMTRRVVALPSVLRRCEAVGAQLVGSGKDARLQVTFRPDPGDVDDVSASSDDGETCGAHAGLGSDLRGTALVLLERLRFAVEPLRGRDGTPPEPGSAGACQACPVCAVVAVLRGERSELAAQLAEHATGLVAVLTAVLEAEDAGPAERPDPPARPPSRPRPEPAARNGEAPRPGYVPRVPGAHGRSVQRITVHRR